MNIIKELIYFDNSTDIYNHKGGAAQAIAMIAKNPKAIEMAKDVVAGVSKHSNKNNTNESDSDDNTNSTNDEIDIDEKPLMSGMLDFWNDIVEIAKDNFKRTYNIFIGWVLTPIIFGSFAPALPFFLVMGVLYAIFNFLQKLIEKL